MFSQSYSVLFISGRVFCKNRQSLRYYAVKVHKSIGIEVKGSKYIRIFDQKELDPRVVALREKLIFSDYLHAAQVPYRQRINALKSYYNTKQQQKEKEPVVSVLLNESRNSEAENEDQSGLEITPADYQGTAKRTRRSRRKGLLKKYGMPFKDYTTDNSCSLPDNWMTDYEQYNELLTAKDNMDIFGTPKPDVPASNVKCMGCGVTLHCKNPAIPGYLPSEIYLKLSHNDLKTTICQRCHFLKLYNVALDVKVSPSVYSELLQVLKRKQCTILLIIDATDLPCSIWPDLATILHKNSRVIVAVNKIDLLPVDSKFFFVHVAEEVSRLVTDITGLSQADHIAGIKLISAKTGFGIERLIDFLWKESSPKHDVYLVGCTNVGKSSLFNRLVNSDYCKLAFADLMHRVTESPWPGTTLNMLKFPIHYLSDKEMFHRFQRTQHLIISSDMMQLKHSDCELHNDIKHATLEEPVTRTKKPPSLILDKRLQTASLSEKPTNKSNKTLSFGSGNWCYDTPGTLHTDQILDLLTIDELTSATPRQIISPRSFVMHPSSTMFLAGVGRIDYVEGEDIVRCTLFASDRLPLTICRTSDADEIYATLLQTEAFVIPINDPERLKSWPKLQSKTFTVRGDNLRVSSADIVLSSVGWVALALKLGTTGVFEAWTPHGRGIHLRSPALLRRSIACCGRRLGGTPLYERGSQVYFGKIHQE